MLSDRCYINRIIMMVRVRLRSKGLEKLERDGCLPNQEGSISFALMVGVYFILETEASVNQCN